MAESSDEMGGTGVAEAELKPARKSRSKKPKADETADTTPAPEATDENEETASDDATEETN